MARSRSPHSSARKRAEAAAEETATRLPFLGQKRKRPRGYRAPSAGPLASAGGAASAAALRVVISSAFCMRRGQMS
jgi:hypothetical protein